MEGLKIKYNVFKVEDGSEVNGCFVLRPDKDPAAVKALRAYALATENDKLAREINSWLDLIETSDSNFEKSEEKEKLDKQPINEDLESASIERFILERVQSIDCFVSNIEDASISIVYKDRFVEFQNRTKLESLNDAKYWLEKIGVAEELALNSTNISIKKFINDYIDCLYEGTPLFEDDYMRFDDCVEYLVESKFDIRGWFLWEIPTFYAHCFLYKDSSKAFDLAVWDGEVIPRYLDSSACERDAKNIDEAIEKYDMSCYL